MSILIISRIAVELSLSVNRLSGTVPFEVGNLSKLGKIFISNSIHGTKFDPKLLTSSVHHCFFLEYLFLANNEIIGTIPFEISMLTNLKEAHLFKNQLEGSIPDGFIDLRTLSK